MRLRRIILWIVGLLRRLSGRGERARRVDPVTEHLEMDELVARVAALFQARQDALAELEAAKARGEGEHVLEQLSAGARRLDRQFRDARVGLRTAGDLCDVHAQDRALAEQYALLVGRDAAGEEVSARAVYAAHRELTDARQRSAIDDAVLQEELREQQERYTAGLRCEQESSGPPLSLEPAGPERPAEAPEAAGGE